MRVYYTNSIKLLKASKDSSFEPTVNVSLRFLALVEKFSDKSAIVDYEEDIVHHELREVKKSDEANRPLDILTFAQLKSIISDPSSSHFDRCQFDIYLRQNLSPLLTAFSYLLRYQYKLHTEFTATLIARLKVPLFETINIHESNKGLVIIKRSESRRIKNICYQPVQTYIKPSVSQPYENIRPLDTGDTESIKGCLFNNIFLESSSGQPQKDRQSRSIVAYLTQPAIQQLLGDIPARSLAESHAFKSRKRKRLNCESDIKQQTLTDFPDFESQVQLHMQSFVEQKSREYEMIITVCAEMDENSLFSTSPIVLIKYIKPIVHAK